MTTDPQAPALMTLLERYRQAVEDSAIAEKAMRQAEEKARAAQHRLNLVRADFTNAVEGTGDNDDE